MNEEMKIRRYESAVKDYPRKASERIIKLEHNWNELKKYLELMKESGVPLRYAYAEQILSIMQKLEEGGNNEY